MINVPVGTIVHQVNGGERLLADLVAAGSEVTVARGGAGGRGNGRLATPVRQAPRIAERGLPGDEATVRLELQLPADVALIGPPNGGKSSLLRRLSRARPKVAEYPFTTVEPTLGTAEVDNELLIVVDTPALVEGAHKGRGLGNAFLQHVRRAYVLIYVLDAAQADPAADVTMVRRELQEFGHGVDSKQWLVALNKIDRPEAQPHEAAHRAAMQRLGAEAYSVSATTGQGIAELMLRALAIVREERERGGHAAGDIPALQVGETPGIAVAPLGGGYDVSGPAVTRVVERLGLETEEARAEVVRRLRRRGLGSALRRAGAQAGDKLLVGGRELEWPG